MVQIISPETGQVMTSTPAVLPTDGDVPVVDRDVQITNQAGIQETKPETITQQTTAGIPKEPTPQPVVTAAAAAAPTPTTEPEIQTSREDVLANFSKFLGREASTDEDLRNVDFLTTLPPAEVERRLTEIRDRIVAEGEAAAEPEVPVTPTPEVPVTPTPELPVTPEGETEQEAEQTIVDQINEIREQNEEERESIRKRLEEAAETLDDRQKAIVDSIGEAFDRRIKQQEQINKALLAGERVRGFTSGRARFASTLQAQVLSNEESAGLARISDLEAQKQEAIAQAELAVAEADFERMNAEMNAFQEAQDRQIAELIELNRLANENERLAIEQMRESRLQSAEDLAIAQAERQETVSTVTSLLDQGISPDLITPDRQRAFEQALGLTPGSFNDFSAGLQQARQFEQIEDEINLNKSLFDLLNKVPMGREVQIGDSTFTGLRDVRDVFTVEKEDPFGNVSVFGIDRNTGQEIFRTDLGQVGKGFKQAGGTVISDVDNNQLLPGTLVNPNTGQQVKLSSAQDTTLSGFNNSLILIDKIKKLAPQVETGPIIGRVSGFLRQLKLDDPKRIELDSLSRNLQAMFQKAISGVAISEQESKRLQKFLPLITDDEKVLEIKINTLENLINQQKNILLGSAGATEVPTLQDFNALQQQPADISDLDFKF